MQADFIILMGTLMLLTAVTAVTPYLTRKSEAFGVSIPESEQKHSALVAERRAHVLRMLVVGLLAMGISLLGSTLWQDTVATPLVGTLLIVVASFFSFYRGHVRMKALKAKENWAARVETRLIVSLSNEDENLPSPLWQMIMPLIVVTTAIITVNAYPGLPESIATHFNFWGNADAFAPKSFGTAFLLVFTQVGLTVLFSFIQYMIKHSRANIDPADQENSLRQARAFRRGWSIYTLVLGSLMVLQMGILQLFTLGILTWKGIFPISFGVIMGSALGAVYLSVKLGQGGSRLGAKKPSTTISMRDDDKYWKLGMFYFNPDDPALFVEKRFGLGWTSNFARPMTYVYIGILVLAIVGLIALVL